MALELPSVAVCCIDTRFPELAEYSLHQSIEAAGIRFGAAYLFTSAAHVGFRRRYDFALRIVEIPDLRSKLAYSQFVIRDLPALVREEYVLVTQWDSYALDAAAWRPEFLDVDYIGAPWPWLPEPRVGNGGFSLRSRRLLEAARDCIRTIDDNEDLLICRRHRRELETRHGVRFADETAAARFAFERAVPSGANFGFHGLFNFDKVMAPGPLQAYVEALPGALALSVEGAELAAQLYNAGRRELGRTLVRKRLQTDAADPPGRALAAQMWTVAEPCWCDSGRPTGACHPPPPPPLAPAPAGQVPAQDAFDADLLRLIPPDLARVVEVGGGSSALAQAYRQANPGTEYIAIDAEAGAAADRAARYSRVLNDDIERLPDDAWRALGAVDCWVFAGSLERLADPWNVLRRVRATLRPGACVVACVPNAQHWGVQTRLLSGALWYEEPGLVQRDHLRLHTRTTLVRMFEACGLRIQTGITRTRPMEHHERVLGALRAYAAALGLDAEQCVRDAAVWQYLVLATAA